MITIKNKKIAWENGMTVYQVLSKVGLVQQCAVVRINGKLISKPNFKSTFVKNNSDIIPLPMIAGG